MVKLDIYSTNKSNDSKLKFITENLPKPPFRWVLVGFSGSGKSTLIKNVVFNDKFYKKYFDEIYIFMGSIDDIHELNVLKKRKRMSRRVQVIGPKLDLVAVSNLYDEIEIDNGKRKNPSRVLMIFDDMITSNSFTSRKLNIIDKLFVQGRHSNVSVMISTQKYKALNTNLRTINTTALTVFGSNLLELKQIAEEHSNHLTRDELLDILKQAQEKKYNSITINYTNDISNRFLDNEFKSLTSK